MVKAPCAGSGPTPTKQPVTPQRLQGFAVAETGWGSRRGRRPLWHCSLRWFSRCIARQPPVSIKPPRRRPDWSAQGTLAPKPHAAAEDPIDAAVT